MQEEVHFKISAALKDIIGRDLITDDYIAVFELVKNAFDAHATHVSIHFENIYSDSPKIIIRDNGKGMDETDLIEKWLFVGYSAKKEGNEDENYRDRIYSNRPFAGAKGIGRFSCDKLGSKLFLESIKNIKGAKTETLNVDWEKFEVGGKAEFIEVTVLHESIESARLLQGHGTALEISDLRSRWERYDFLKLKSALSKLIDPLSENGKSQFTISVHVPEEIERDQEEEEEYNKVNTPVRNFIFHTLGLKTTSIQSSISSDGKVITTELTDGNTTIYRVTERNPFNLLKGIDYKIYFLNQSAKATFTRRMGLPTVQFGHIFLYKNGFRVYPYGEPGEDPLKIDSRKAGGVRRYLGTRDIIGQISINSNSDELKETSSRGDGLKKTPSYDQLELCFKEVLKRLEKYVVEVQQWGISIEDEASYNLKDRASALIAKLTGSNDIIDFETPKNFLEIIEASQSNSAEVIIKNLKRIALETENEKLIDQASKASYKLVQIQEARLEAEKQIEQEVKRAEQATEQLREQLSENLFLKSINSTDFEEVISLVHHIGIYAGTIDNNLKGILLRVQNNIALTNDELYNIVRSISFEVKKILNVVSFATKANFKLTTDLMDINLRDYFREYILNIIPTTTDKSLKINFIDKSVHSYIRQVKPIEINIVIDNIINNARKAGSSEMEITLSDKNEKFQVEFKDNGGGISEGNIKKIYDFGFTTTDGSGLGLFHVKKILSSIGGSIVAVPNKSENGVTFILEFK